MPKKQLIIIGWGIIILVLVIAIVLNFSISKKKSKEFPSTEEIKTEPQKEETFKTIKGIGFKEGAWSKYKLENWGMTFKGGQEIPQVTEMIVKTLKFKINEKEFLGIEEEIKGENQRMSYLILFEKEGKGENYSLAKIDSQLICSPFLSGTERGIYQEFKKENIETDYQIEEDFSFIKKEKIKLESGKEIEVLKFKQELLFEEEGMTYTGREAWFSGEVPLYFVYLAEKYKEENKEKEGPTIKLVDFDLSGATSLFTENDLKKCFSSQNNQPPFPLSKFKDKLYCESDNDCACGVDKETGECAFGNKEYILEIKQCPDFCSGVGGNMRIKCVNNTCLPLFQ